MSKFSKMKEPEWLIFLRAVLFGLLLAEVCRIGFLSSLAWGHYLADHALIGEVIVIVSVVAIGVLTYAWHRDVHQHARSVVASRRWDLGLLVAGGVWLDQLVEPKLNSFHGAISKLDSGWSQATLFVLFTVLMSPIARAAFRPSIPELTQLTFISDVEIDGADDDVLNVTKQATAFADTVLTSGVGSGLVFGIDGPWGVGKTSFLNIATDHWAEKASESVIIFKFEPLRYASEPDLSERFIKDLCAKIRQDVFAPEFLPAATRYSKMLKGKTDVSFLGWKFTLEPSTETIDELLDNIDNLLQQIGRRLIIVIDDLDRLEPKLVNNVLFTVRRTFNLSQATYILCYDTEQLIAGKDEGGRAREFLEKFITAKLSLFVDLKSIKAFLETDWHKDAERFPTMPVEVLFKLRQITTEVGGLITGRLGHEYIPLLGDLRKVKRFVNALLLMNLEKVDLGLSDFHDADLINLVLLHLFYPGTFRRLHAEETDDRSGSFSVRRSEPPKTASYENAAEFETIINEAEPGEKFLLKQLFDVKILDLDGSSESDEGTRRSRACFNFESRNLEKYLELIVRFKVPEPTTTFRMYKELVDSILKSESTIGDVMRLPEFAARDSEVVHDQFWRVLVSHAHRLSRAAADEAISKLIAQLPDYSLLDPIDRSPRHRSVYSLVLLLDQAGYGEPRPPFGRASTDVVEIGFRILGERYGGSSPTLIEQLAAPERGALGWEDLMLFRINCSIDRLNQVHNICIALMRYEDPDARVEGDVGVLAKISMRRFSQQVFRKFRLQYIDKRINFFDDVDTVDSRMILGKFKTASSDLASEDLETRLSGVRTGIKGFVIWQLVNRRHGDGAGIGCGFYDEDGEGDAGGIYRAMSTYLLDFCFNPSLGVAHARSFADYCLRAFRDALAEDANTPNVARTQSILTRLLTKDDMVRFWATSGDLVKALLGDQNGVVHGQHYRATYAERLPLVFEALDQLVGGDPPAP